MSMNLRHMGFNEALDAAKQRSGLTNEAIANRSSLSTAAVSRYFNKYDDYTPSPELIPLLCRALGNTIIADWIAAQVALVETEQATMDELFFPKLVDRNEKTLYEVFQTGQLMLGDGG